MNALTLSYHSWFSTPSLRLAYAWLCRRTGRAWTLALLLPMLLLSPWLLLGRLAGSDGFLGTATGLLLVLLLSTSLVSDLFWRRIFNWVIGTCLIWLGLLHVVGQLLQPPPEWLGTLPPLEALAGFLLCGGVMLGLFCTFGSSAGDVKLLAALGAMLGPGAGFATMLYGYVGAGAFALALVVVRLGLVRLLCSVVAGRGPIPAHEERERTLWETLRARLPMAPFFAAGVVAALRFGW